MSAQKHYDALILGSGQGGTPLATAFAKAGRKTCLVERAHIGGCCINEGCTPTKTMIASGKVAYLARRREEYGVHFRSSAAGIEGEEGGGAEGGGESGGVWTDMKKVRQRKREMVESFRAGSERRLGAAGVDVLRGEAAFVGPKTVRIRMEDPAEEEEVVVSSELVFINSGERPAKPKIEGLDGIEPARVLDSTSIQELDEVPGHLIVLGGGYIGLEFGQLFRRLGAQVTIVQRSGQVIPREDPDIAECMLDILRGGGITVHLSTEAVRLSSEDSTITLHTKSPDGTTSLIFGSHLLLAAGRVPNTDHLSLPVAGIETTPRGHIVVNPRLETNIPGIYALGDVKGPPAFTHVSYDDFRIVRDNLLSVPFPSAPDQRTTAARVAHTPYVVYTDPQLGHVGMHERQIRSQHPGRKIKVAKMPMEYVARALEMGETRGMMKAVVDADTGEILGFTCLGVEGGEIMSVVQVAMMGGLRWEGLREAVFAHPTLAESLNNLWGFLEE